ncbi:MAG TPA: hypothetical protein VF433_15665, partial [Cellvibrio sp.]
TIPNINTTMSNRGTNNHALAFSRTIAPATKSTLDNIAVSNTQDFTEATACPKNRTIALPPQILQTESITTPDTNTARI